MWFIFALLYSWFYAFSIEVNKHYPFDGLLTVVWRSFFATVGMLFVLPFMHWPSNSTYYGVIAVSTVTAIWARQRLFNLVVKHNSRVACLQLPIAIVVTFLAWLVIDVQERQRMIEEPLYAVGSVSAVLLVIASVLFIRKNDTSWSAMKVILPIGVMYASLGVLAKLMLDTDASSLGITLNWVFLHNLGTTALGALLLLRRRKLEGLDLRPKNIEKAAFYGALLHTIAWVFSALAVIYAANPAYPAILGALIPMWFALYYKVFGIKDDFSPISGFFLASAAVLLLIVTL